MPNMTLDDARKAIAEATKEPVACGLRNTCPTPDERCYPCKTARIPDYPRDAVARERARKWFMEQGYHVEAWRNGTPEFVYNFVCALRRREDGAWVDESSRIAPTLGEAETLAMGEAAKQMKGGA